MGARKKKTSTKPKKPTTEPVPQTAKPTTKTATGINRPRPEFRRFEDDEALRYAMGEEEEDISDDLSQDNTNQSKPNFSFLPSHQHSSPRGAKQTNGTTGTENRIASTPILQNLETPSTSSASTSLDKSSQPLTKGKSGRRKQATPRNLKLIKDIVHLQSTVHNLIPKMSFGRLIREILIEYSNSHLKVTRDMLVCLQEAAEIYVVQVFEDAYRCTLHRGRVTLLPKDMQLVLFIRGDMK
ncbi:histone H3-like centromeric protein A [Anopheles bellator]|uniref:histone H3-like centromeric protein A n=1 Tax=Anopheles bellator TaxID=139047 RepID=UPI002647B5F0|nr:histone H3-like centromeric protein A [Anopheles bellator]